MIIIEGRIAWMEVMTASEDHGLGFLIYLSVRLTLRLSSARRRVSAG